jgi:hypothetical protein
MTTSRSPPTLETLPPELLDRVLESLLEDAREVKYLGRGSWSDAAVLDFFNLSRTSARLRTHFWPAFLAQTTFVLQNWRLYSSAQLQALLSLTSDPGRSIKKVAFHKTKYYIDVEIKNNKLKRCTVEFRSPSGWPHRANEPASQHLRIAIVRYALEDGRMDWPLVLQFTCHITPLVGTSLNLEDGILLPNGRILPARSNTFASMIGRGPRIPLEESLQSLERELDHYGIEKSEHPPDCVGDCFQDYMEQSAVETLLLSAQFLQCMSVKGSEHFPDLRGAKLLEYNSETRQKLLIALSRQLSQHTLAEVLEQAEATETAAKSAEN